MIKVNHLSKKFGNLEVLKDINLNINEGEVVCIIGPSGSGKSTFLHKTHLTMTNRFMCNTITEVILEL